MNRALDDATPNELAQTGDPQTTEPHSSNKRFLFTVDVDWIPGSQVGLELLYGFAQRHALATTLFVTGRFATEYPEVLRLGVDQGHELGTHGWEHGQKDPSSEEDFQRASYALQREWMERSTEAVLAATGVRPRGFRAPNLWISETTLRVLEELEYAYDSSVPARRITTGYSRRNSWRYFSAPLDAYRPSRDNFGRKGSSRIVELPPATFFVPINMSALRTLGLPLVLWAVRRLAKRSPLLVFYSHPAEFVDVSKQSIRADVPKRFRSKMGPQNLALLDAFVSYVKSLGFVAAHCSDIKL